MAHLGEHGFDLGELAGFAPPDAAALSWPGFCRMLRRLRDAATNWAGQVGLVRAWYQPHLGSMVIAGAADVLVDQQRRLGDGRGGVLAVVLQDGAHAKLATSPSE